MKIIETKKNSLLLEVATDELGILHYALHDYLQKCENNKRKDKCNKGLKEATDSIRQMVETIDALI